MRMRASDWQELFRPELAAFTIILNLGIGLHAVDVFVISTVMPTVVKDIGGASFYAWSTMLYMVASIVGAASGGPLKAALGPRKGYALGGLLFLTGSAACGASPTMLVLLIARTVQGYGGGLLLAQSMGLISELYPPALRTRILATVSGVWGVAALVGPLVGGVFAEFDWWRGAFWASTPDHPVVHGAGLADAAARHGRDGGAALSDPPHRPARLRRAVRGRRRPDRPAREPERRRSCCWSRRSR